MNPLGATGSYVRKTGLFTDGSAGTDSELCQKLWSLSMKYASATGLLADDTGNVPSDVSRKRLLLHRLRFSGAIMSRLMDPFGATMAVEPPEAISEKGLAYVNLIDEAITRTYAERMANSTVPQEPPEGIDQYVEAVFNAAREEDFEDGMESRFSRELTSVVRQYGDHALSQIAYLITYERASSEVASEALRWLGRIDHPATHEFRLWLLTRSLECTSARVRDGAALGLAFMGDPDAIPYLKKAIDREKCRDLGEDMELVLEELQGMRYATSTKGDTQV